MPILTATPVPLATILGPTMSQITFTLGEPVDGWLPVSFSYSDFSLDFETSDVPKDPVESLCEALVSLNNGRAARVEFFLEPVVYTFDFEPLGAELALQIGKSDGDKASVLFEGKADMQSNWCTLASAVLQFSRGDYKEPDWPNLNYGLADAVAGLVRRDCR